MQKLHWLFCGVNFTFLQNHNSPVENQNDLELDFKVFSLLILVVEALYLMTPTDATLASFSFFEIFKMASKMAIS